MFDVNYESERILKEYSEGKLFYIYYEYNIYNPEWNYENWGSKYWYLTPEFIKAFQMED